MFSGEGMGCHISNHGKKGQSAMVVDNYDNDGDDDCNCGNICGKNF